MRFVETPVFTREMQALLQDDLYRSLQLALMFRPEAGALIPGGAGLRKIRWGLAGKGKRCQEDLSPAQLRELRKIVKENFK